MKHNYFEEALRGCDTMGDRTTLLTKEKEMIQGLKDRAKMSNKKFSSGTVEVIKNRIKFNDVGKVEDEFCLIENGLPLSTIWAIEDFYFSEGKWEIKNKKNAEKIIKLNVD